MVTVMITATGMVTLMVNLMRTAITITLLHRDMTLNTKIVTRSQTLTNMSTLRNNAMSRNTKIRKKNLQKNLRMYAHAEPRLSLSLFVSLSLSVSLCLFLSLSSLSVSLFLCLSLSVSLCLSLSFSLSRYVVEADIKQNSYCYQIKNLNIRGVLLHIIGDALGSVAVIISGMVIFFSDSPDAHLADPISR